MCFPAEVEYVDEGLLGFCEDKLKLLHLYESVQKIGSLAVETDASPSTKVSTVLFSIVSFKGSTRVY